LLFSLFRPIMLSENSVKEDNMKKQKFVYEDKDNNYEYVVTRREKKNKGHPFLTAIVIFLVIGFIGSNSSSNDSSTPKQSNSPKATSTVAVTKAPTATSSTVPTAEPTSDPTATPFTVEHDEEYYATQEYIYKFLTEKGYEVQVIIGVPNIGRYEDTNPDDSYVNWYAYIKRNGKWQEFVVVLFNGEVSAIRPVK